MKRIVALILLAGLCLGLCACGIQQSQQTAASEPTQEVVTFFVPEPMEYPNYTFDGTPTTDELRQMAVQAMQDMLSIQWSVGKFVYYNKSGSVSGKFFSHVPEVIYAGMPYTNGASGLVQWMEFYDTETGRFSFEGTGAELNDLLGNSCAACVSSAWMTVCNSAVKGSSATYYMTPMNGYLPVGPYQSNYGISSYEQYPTDRICADNGQEVMYASYAAILPADALVSTPDVHAIMAIEAAHVVYNEDGSINGTESTVTIADQRAGNGDLFYEVDDGNGNTLNFSGRTHYDYTFEELWKLCYIPVTSAEFMGTKEYEVPKVTFSNAASTLQEAAGGSITSNYPIRVIRGVLVDGDGNEQVYERVILNNDQISTGMTMNYSLSNMTVGVSESALKDFMESGKTYTLRIEVAMPNGENFTVVEIAGLSA